QGNDWVSGQDGLDEVVVGTGRIRPPGTGCPCALPVVSVYGIDGTQITSFHASADSFDGGVYVATGNFDGDPTNGDEIVTGAGPGGGPHVKIFHLNGSQPIDISNGGFFAFDSRFRGGVRVAAGNMLGDAKDEVVTGAGPGGGPEVAVWGLTNNSWASAARW